MSYLQLQQVLLGSGGVAVGIFLGAVIGLSFRARSAGTDGLFRGSVYATAFIASALAFFASVVIRIFF
ncbi:hypothetical protein AQS8620_01610 [Aquimixticola soesokkakensis]|uniref:Uncharacterized protein n=1 Tax=Aquimixticola soesokkakensis TaxID=1519096 RepID=A0A1Y5SIP7_9RHOB|nr:hypothetical protein [Aquimixticola soesokkakensis]SLN41602.1 hypothetical protein AQS8620_01610 [Aquimixticola soesokkakensis]